MLTALNDGPTLADFGPSVIFTLAEVNSAPQIIDGDVTFNDPEDNFTGGSLVLAGLLAEDIVSIRNQGTGAGEIGFTSGIVTFGGVFIGSAVGGSGTTMTVTFNAAANSAGIEALIENLTYQDLSHDPTPSRTITLTVTDLETASTGPVPDIIDIISSGVTIIGTARADLINASHTVAGQPLPTRLADDIRGRGGDDSVSALAGDDRVIGGAGNDLLRGNAGNDLIRGNAGNDLIVGGAGDDDLAGNAGNDRLNGGRGNNTLTGGVGDDIFLFTNRPGTPGGPPWIAPDAFSTITDFKPGEDAIGLSRAVFGSLDNVSYKAATGYLVFDAPGAGHPVKFALLARGLHLDDGDLFLV